MHLAFTQSSEHSRRVWACGFSLPHALDGTHLFLRPSTRPSRAWRQVQGHGDGVRWGLGGQAVWLQGKQVGGLRACGSLSPELEVDSCFVSGETVPHGVTCLSPLSSPWRPWARAWPQEAPGLGRREVAMTSGYVLPLHPQTVSLLLAALFSRNFCWSL